MTGDALFSDDRRYRYWLTRTWNDKLPICCFIGLNPSTADAKKNDRTIAKIVNYCQQWGYGRLLMLNLYAYRTPYPTHLWKVKKQGSDHIGLDGNGIDSMLKYLKEFNVKVIVCAWGSGKQHYRGMEVARILREDYSLFCLKLTADGSPSHPLYLPNFIIPMLWLGT